MATIFQRGKNWYISYMTDGRRVRQSLKTKSKNLAEKEKNRIETEIEKGNLGLAPRKIKPLTALNEYIDILKRTKSPSWSKRCVQLLNPLKRFFFDYCDRKSLKDIRQVELESLLKKREQEINAKTYNEELRLMKNFFDWTIERGYLFQNPAKRILRKYYKSPPPRAFSKEEVKLVLNIAVEPQKSIYEFLLHTGLRLGELIYLEWDDIDFQNNQINIRIKKNWKPKTSTNRVIPMTERTKEIILRQSKRSDYIFTTKTGRQQVSLYDRFQHLLKKISEKHGVEIPHANIHTFRHTFATHCLMNGIDIYTVSKYLGHTSVKMTEKYLTLLPEYAKREIEKLSYD